MAIQMKAIEQCLHVVLFIMMYKVVLTFKSVEETLVCDHSKEIYFSSNLTWYDTILKSILYIFLYIF